jgi:hypothetical protein
MNKVGNEVNQIEKEFNGTMRNLERHEDFAVTFCAFMLVVVFILAQGI